MGEKLEEFLEVLIVDDDNVVTRLHRYAINNFIENRVRTFGNGKEALDYLERSAFTKEKFLVLLDLNMPVLNGWEFLDALHKKTFCRKVQVVILTSSSYRQDFLNARQYRQVIGFFTKPLNRDLLEEIFNLSFENKGNLQKVRVNKT